MKNTTPCLVCNSGAVHELLDFGNQALCNRYLSATDETEASFPFVLGQCDACALVQLTQPVPPRELKARVDWIRYNEQEGHLDHLVETICGLPGVTTASSVGAISFKDDTTVGRFQKKGFTNTWRLDMETDLGLADPTAGLEMIQALLTPQVSGQIGQKRGRVDILIVRHILEHAHSPRAFAQALAKLVKPGGYLVFEVPDCEPALRRRDYSMPWEEHVLYFTPQSFQRSLASLNFHQVHYHCYPYANENSLIAIVQTGGGLRPASEITAEADLAMAYAAAFNAYRDGVASVLEEHRRLEEKIAVFGAGHLSCFWINALGVGRLIEFVVDDHPNKRGLFMPGSRLPVRGSSALIDENIRLCLLSLSPESEAKVVEKNRAFVEKGGTFGSMFPGNAKSLKV